MPLKRREAEKLLDLLWKCRIAAKERSEEDGNEDTARLEDRDEAAFSKAISILHCYITDILPSVHPTLQLSGSGVEVSVCPDAVVQELAMPCDTTRDPGLVLQSYTSSGTRLLFVSRVEKGTICDNAKIFKRGDILLQINGHSVAHLSTERAR